MDPVGTSRTSTSFSSVKKTARSHMHGVDPRSRSKAFSFSFVEKIAAMTGLEGLMSLRARASRSPDRGAAGRTAPRVALHAEWSKKASRAHVRVHAFRVRGSLDSRSNRVPRGASRTTTTVSSFVVFFGVSGWFPMEQLRRRWP